MSDTKKWYKILDNTESIEKGTVHETTISDVMIETMVNWSVDTVFGMEAF